MRRRCDWLWSVWIGCVVGCSGDEGASATTETTAEVTTAEATTAESTTAMSSTGEAPTTTGVDPTTGAVMMCGDGVVQPPEVCDDGDMVDEDACTSACALYFPSGCPARLRDQEL